MHNQSAILNYIARYICFIKSPKSDREDNTWLEYYLDLNQIDQKFINIFANEDFNLIQPDHNHQSAANQYIHFKILG